MKRKSIQRSLVSLLTGGGVINNDLEILILLLETSFLEEKPLTYSYNFSAIDTYLKKKCCS